jgi:putative Ca2+/H+ antiporter (TMEM165/GDT1 family)
VDAFAVALGIVFVAELGDKTQLVVLTFGARQRPLPALAGLTAAAAVLMALAVTAGAAVGAALPDRAVAALAGFLFLGFAVWAWRETATEEEEGRGGGEHGGGADRNEVDGGGRAAPAPPRGTGPDRPAEQRLAGRDLRALVVAFFLAELGDKTQITAASLAADRGVAGTWVGATLGLVGATAIALFAGRALAQRISARTLTRIGAVAFALVGIVSLAAAARG